MTWLRCFRGFLLLLLAAMVTAQVQHQIVSGSTFNQDGYLLLEDDSSLNLACVPGAVNIFVYWDPINNTDSYDVIWTTTEGNDGMGNTDLTYFLIASTIPCSEYDVMVVAKLGDQEVVNETIQTTTEAQAPPSVFNLVIERVDTEPRLIVTWDPVLPSGNCEVNYTVIWKQMNISDEVQEQVTADSHYVIEDLAYCTICDVCVFPFTYGYNASSKCDKNPVEYYPQPVTELVVTQNDEQPELEVNWTYPDSAPEECDLHYKVSWHDTGEVNSQTDNTDDLGYTITDLTYCLDYSVCVQPYVSGQLATEGECPVVPIIAIPEAPSHLSSTDQTEESITVQWEEPPKKGECVVVGYNITWLEDMEPQSIEGDTLKYYITDLDPDSDYTILLVAQYEAGWGPYANLTERTKNRDEEKEPNVGAIVGGVIGGLVLVAIIVAAVVKRKKIKKMVTKNNKSTSTQNITNPHSSNIQLQDSEGHTRSYDQYT